MKTYYCMNCMNQVGIIGSYCIIKCKCGEIMVEKTFKGRIPKEKGVRGKLKGKTPQKKVL